ncbi:MAG: hypothetical protein M1818_000910 [Claussenomyces sp. TS43310]|nr:MAG: hypothetical protein M1818_000910 [Claussenomyces sp. TS43310]
MNHTDTTSRFAHFLTPIAYLQENYPAIPFVLGEVGSDLNPTPRVNDNALEAAFGSTLWTVDFMLYAMSKNVSAISMQQGTGFGYAAWQPIAYNGLGPHVRGPYYGLACVADFIGTAAADLQVSNIDLSSATLSAYAGYIAGRLAKVAIVNLAYYNASSSSSSSSSSEAARPTQPVTFAVPAAVAAVRVDHLVGPDSSAPTGIYWAGVSWTIAALGRGTLVRNDTQTLDVVDGLVTLTLDASEAVIVTML